MPRSVGLAGTESASCVCEDLTRRGDSADLVRTSPVPGAATKAASEGGLQPVLDTRAGTDNCETTGTFACMLGKEAVDCGHRGMELSSGLPLLVAAAETSAEVRGVRIALADDGENIIAGTVDTAACIFLGVWIEFVLNAACIVLGVWIAFVLTADKICLGVCIELTLDA